MANGQPSVASETTQVTVTEITDKQIAGYVSSGEPMDKAGAYAIQGIASCWIPRIEGDYNNVVGLPVALVWRMLRSARLAKSDLQNSADFGARAGIALNVERAMLLAALAILSVFLPGLSSTT